MQQVYASTRALQDIHTAYKPAVTYPQTSLASGLRVLAETVNARLGLRVGYVSLGGFDTHDSELIGQPPLLQRLDQALKAFYEDLEAHGQADRVTTMIWSEFGRRVTENASGGTDHGKGNVVLVLGPPVKGGLYGEPLDLGKLDNGDVAFRTDFRSVYATLLQDWMQTDAKEALGARYSSLGFMRV